MWALIVDGQVSELAKKDPAGKFHEDLLWVKAGSKVKVGDLYIDGEFSTQAPEQLTEEQILSLRRQAYRNESDPLKIEAEYDALVGGKDPDYTGWLSSVDAIKARYPLP